jgi:hypothetical protein
MQQPVVDLKKEYGIQETFKITYNNKKLLERQSQSNLGKLETPWLKNNAQNLLLGILDPVSQMISITCSLDLIT